MKKFVSCILLIVMVGCSKKTNSEKGNMHNVPNDMVYIPFGQYLMGGKSDQADPDELPRRSITISPFYLDQTEVTNKQFKRFIDETNYITVAERPVNWEEMMTQLPPNTPKPADSLLSPGSLVFFPTNGPVQLSDYSQWWRWEIGANWLHPEGPESTIDNRMDHPVVHITREDALAYAKWAGKRLPTEAEWEWAAMGGMNDVKYPWGNESIEYAFKSANFWQGSFPYENKQLDGFYYTSPVKSYPPNGYDLYDMAGNVWEWCEDKYHYKAYSQGKDSKDPKGPLHSLDPMEPYATKYVIRGGSYLCNDSYCSGYRVARRMKGSEDSSFNHTGFRCAKSIN